MNTKLNKILLGILIYLATIILITTIFAFTQKKQNNNNSLFTKDLQPNQLEQIDNANILESFTGLGRIRISTHPDSKGKKVPLVVSPWFSYQKGDEQFFEELSKKSSIIKSIIVQYFSLYTEEELQSLSETEIKTEITSQINQHLILGQIENIYFSEYIFLK